MNVAIIGCGKIGQRRAKALRKEDRIAYACDIDYFRAADMYEDGGDITDTWRYVIDEPGIEAVIIATTPDVAPEIARAAVAAGKYVLIEKPAAHRAELLDGIDPTKVRVGFNLRYHKAIVRARKMFERGEIGDLIYIRARYGHGGRLGYEKEWRSDPKISGGGVLIDLGVHLIDLCGLFMGEVISKCGAISTTFWDSSVEDNVFLCMRAPEIHDSVSWLHVSSTEWKNTFQFEIFGQNGKLEVNGLGGSYGVESCTLYKMLPEMGPPETTKWEYPMADDSFEREWLDFCEDIALKRTPTPGIREAQAALRIVEQVYEANR